MSENFMVKDILLSLAALLGFALIAVPPGYAIAWLTDLLSFRSLAVGERLAVAINLSFGICPVAFYLIAAFLGINAVLGLAAIFLVAFVVVLILALRSPGGGSAGLERLSGDRPQRLSLAVTGIAVGVWVMVAILILMDVQVGQQLFPSVTFYDYTKHAAITDAISRTGVPPDNPFFYPGHPQKLFYYYFWFLYCSVVDVVGGPLITARAASIGGAICAGVGFILMLQMLLKTFVTPNQKTSFRLVCAGGLCLLLVSGFDFIPALLVNSIDAARHNLLSCASVDWWNGDAVTGLLGTMLWVPQHIAALCVCFLVSLMIRTVVKDVGDRQVNFVHAGIGGICIASAFGMSVYVTICFGVIWACWLWQMISQKSKAPATQLAVTLAAGALCTSPFLLELYNHGTHTQQIGIGVRTLAILDVLFPLPAPASYALDLATLPIYYFFELGFYAIVALVYLRNRKKFPSEPFLLIAFICSLVISTFLRSTVRNNDLGNRAILPAQVVTLIWAVQMIRNIVSVEKPVSILRALPPWMVVCAGLGIATTAYDLYLLRTYELVSDGARNYAHRAAYEFMATTFPVNSIVAYNPQASGREPYFFGIDPFYGSCANRQLVVSDKDYGMMFGVDREDFMPVYDKIIGLFRGAETRSVCTELGITTLIVKRDLPLWKDDAVLIEFSKPVYQNEFLKLYQTSTATAQSVDTTSLKR